MRRHEAETVTAPAAAPSAPRATPPATARWSRRRGVVGVFAAFCAIGFVAAYVGPTGAALAEANDDDAAAAVSIYKSSIDEAQTLVTSEDAQPQEAASLDRGGYTVYVAPKETPKPAPKSASSSSSGTRWTPPFVSPDPGSAQAIAYDMVKARGWGDDEFACLVALWNKESGWRVNAYNRGSGAYGIPQALPGSKMGSAGADWETNPATQIAWGLGYIGGRYGTPCGAWGHSQSTGWY
ncbi:lytic transglycosylase domain-containing protein [Microbacterium ulmi]|uniref:Lytic transglycosylase domain-containing protein n=2 Tax=Microbacterium ulmi TaxID=179095 RepID=A0A7Y2LY15_9MICO|nr:lytic transglycosylase domain-containing protein [Microbacterium ulmi]NNH02509.1 lytic transglycosylase domain-containing protein [Microbacterium ulmi]